MTYFLQISEISAAFNEWMRLFTEDPTKFEHEWQTVDQFLTETMSGREPSYGDASAAFLLRLMGKESSERVLVQSDRIITRTYTNWCGETAERKIIPLRIWFGATQWHPEPQWLLAAIDVEKGAERDFALRGFGSGPAEAEVRLRAEKEIAENEDAIAAARAEYGRDDKTSVPGILATLRREVLRKAGWNAAEEDWIGAIECLAQADAYAYAEREIRERELDGLAEARGLRLGLSSARGIARSKYARNQTFSVMTNAPSDQYLAGYGTAARQIMEEIGEALSALADKPEEPA